MPSSCRRSEMREPSRADFVVGDADVRDAEPIAIGIVVNGEGFVGRAEVRRAEIRNRRHADRVRDAPLASANTIRDAEKIGDAGWGSN